MQRLRSPAVPLALLAAGGLILAVLWAPAEVADAQKRIIRTLITGGLTLLALVLWFGFCSPCSGRVRALCSGAFAGLALFVGLGFRIEGTSGNLVPKLRPRWAAPRDAEIGEVVAVSAPVTDPGVAFPQFLGPGRDAVVDVALARDWGARPPKLLWKREVGAGWSGFVVAGGRAVTQEQRGPLELVVCYELLTGRPLWRHADETRYETVLGGVGPRATPAVAGGRVYALGATGRLNCLELETGRRLWSADIARDAAAGLPDYGYAGSPLVEGSRVVVQPGGREGAALAAYDAATGKRVWSAGSERAAYASPAVHELGGLRQLVALNWDSCTGHDLGSGAQLWRFEWGGEQPKAAQPVALGGDRLVISAGYSQGAEAFRVLERGKAWGVEALWSSRHLMAKFSNVVHREGHLYGLSDGVLTCVNAGTGLRVWRGGAYGHGQLLLAGDLLLISAEDGRALLEAAPAAFRELGSLPVLGGKTWNGPALAGSYLLMRNDREAACLELPR